MPNIRDLMHNFFRIFNENSDALPVSGTVTATGVATETTLAAIDANAGDTTDAAVVTDANGTLSGKLRGLVAILADVWDNANNLLRVSVQNASVAVTGTFWQVTQPVSLASLPSLAAGAQNIGDVDVLSVPGALQGSGNPTVDSYSSAAVDLAASTADQVLIAAPGADKQIWVYGLFMMADTAAGTVTLQDDSDAALSGTMAVSDEGGWVLPLSGNFAMPWIKVATNKALEADTGACTVDGIICYGIVSV